MTPHQGEVRHSVVYGRLGKAIFERIQIPDPPDRPTDGAATGTEPARVRNVMSNDLVCADEELEVSVLAGIVASHHIGCIPIVDRSGRAIGMVTKTDLVQHLDATLRPLATRAFRPHVVRARDIMMPLAFTLPEWATLTQAANLMVLEDLHHVLVVSETGVLVGVVSSLDLVRWMVETDRLASNAALER